MGQERMLTGGLDMKDDLACAHDVLRDFLNIWKAVEGKAGKSGY